MAGSDELVWPRQRQLCWRSLTSSGNGLDFDLTSKWQTRGLIDCASWTPIGLEQFGIEFVDSRQVVQIIKRDVNINYVSAAEARRRCNPEDKFKGPLRFLARGTGLVLAVIGD